MDLVQDPFPLQQKTGSGSVVVGCLVEVLGDRVCLEYQVYPDVQEPHFVLAYQNLQVCLRMLLSL